MSRKLIFAMKLKIMHAQGFSLFSNVFYCRINEGYCIPYTLIVGVWKTLLKYDRLYLTDSLMNIVDFC